MYRPPPANNGLAIASFVCGILALVPGCCCGVFDLPLSVIALVMGVIGLSQINASGGQIGGKGLAIAGIVCGGFGLFVSVGSATFHLSQYVTRTLHI